MAMKKVRDFHVDDLGMQHSQYFQGYGVAFTEFTDCACGTGDNPGQALDDCLEQIASNCEVDVEDLERRILLQYPDYETCGDKPSVAAEFGDDAEDIFYYVGIKWKF
jgi:arginyl-tRNA synthetase